MAELPRWKILWPVLRQLGWRQAGLFALYQLGLRSGHYRRAYNPAKAIPQVRSADAFSPKPLWQLPSGDDLHAVLGETGRAQLLAEADEIVAGQVRLFGGPAVPLRLTLPGPLAHWTAYGRGETAAGDNPYGDIKWTWEPGRLGWAYTLGRAYWLSQDERYAVAFWRWMDIFLQANPPYHGPHWASAQEVALRLIALTFCWQVFAAASNAQQAAQLAQAVAVHAQRIPPTLVYARAQNNNHLLSEAAGLYTAGLFLPAHPAAERWRKLGWRWFNQGIQAQVASDGSYVQHSTSYHRLMLQIASWVSFLAQSQEQVLPDETQNRLAAATGWLLKLIDPESGRVPNLGPNDGAYILPLTVCPHDDYRPVLQAAAIAFLGKQSFAQNPCDEINLWLGGKRTAPIERRPPDREQPDTEQTPHVLRSPDGASWAYLRAARFTGRPGHADQLHFDLWWRGLNVAQDAGTFLYNAPPPWDNSLASTSVHNTLVIDGHDQMRRASRFLYLGRAQAKIEKQGGLQDNSRQWISAQHDGYHHLGLWHKRFVTVGATGNWEITDTVYPIKTPMSDQPHTVCLHWLLPDWPWQVLVDPSLWGIDIDLGSPFGPVHLHVQMDQVGKVPVCGQLQIARAGELLYGSGPVLPIWGWVSPTYGVKIPALSVHYTITSPVLIRLTSEFIFPPPPGVEKV